MNIKYIYYIKYKKLNDKRIKFSSCNCRYFRAPHWPQQENENDAGKILQNHKKLTHKLVYQYLD